MFQSAISELRARLGERGMQAVVAGVVLCLGIGLWAWSQRTEVGSATYAEGSAGLLAAESLEASETASESVVPSEPPEPVSIHVHVVGAVLRPGVYEVLEGARVGDVVAVAGGLTGNAAEVAVNLARVVVDGEQILVPTRDEYERAGSPPPTPSGGSGRAAPAASSGAAGAGAAQIAQQGPVNVNTADSALLETLPGIGPATAAKIIADREANGPFQAVEDLLRVSGIGEKKLEAMRGLVTVR